MPAYGGVGAWAVGSNASPTPGYPAGVAAGDLILCLVVHKWTSGNENQVPTVTDYALTTTGRNGTTVTGNSAGSVRGTVLEHVAASALTGSVTVSVTNNGFPLAARLMRWAKNTATNTWQIAGTTGTDGDEATTAVSATGGSLALTTGDWLVVHVGIKDDAPTHASQVVDVPGCTLGAITWLAKDATTTGNDLGGYTGYVEITAGTATGAPVYTATASATSGSSTTVNFIRVREGAPPKTATLTDQFATANTALWNGYGTNPSVDSGQLRISMPAAAGYPAISSAATYDLTGSHFRAEVRQAQHAGAKGTFLQVEFGDGNNTLEVVAEGGNLLLRRKVAGTVNDAGTIAYDPLVHRWWGIRESAGTVIWETSPTGQDGTWVTLRSEANPFTAAATGAVRLLLRAGYHTGAETGDALFDNVNLPEGPRRTVRSIVTTNDQAKLVATAAEFDLAGDVADHPTVISVDDATTYQSIVGFGAAMTEASAKLITDLPAATRDTLMREFFHPTDGLGLSMIRTSIGATDFGLGDYTYADTKGPAGDELANFSVDREDTYVVPRIKQALALNPNIKLMATPWSPPAWMRTGNTLKGDTGGTLDPVWYGTYAQYFVKYIQAMASRGLTIDYLSVQNEPDFAPTYIGMKMSSAQQITFIKDHLAPAFANASITTKILGWDHNWDQDTVTAGNQTTFVDAILADAGTKSALGGIAWHGYAGDPSVQTTVRNAHPTIDHFFTEITEHSAPNFSDDLRWNTRTITIGALANWSRSALMWNFALDQNGGPTNGGSSTVRGLVTINTVDSTYAKQPAYYSLAQASRFIRPGVARVARTSSNPHGIIHTEGYKDANGAITLHVLNDGASDQPLTLKWGGFEANTTLAMGVTTYRWNSAPLAAPTNPAATALDSTSIRVTWTAVAGASSYVVERSADGATGWTQVGTPAGETFTDTGLTASTAYYYRVSARSVDGQQSASSSTVNATTPSSTVTVSGSAALTSASAVGAATTSTIAATSTVASASPVTAGGALVQPGVAGVASPSAVTAAATTAQPAGTTLTSPSAVTAAASVNQSGAAELRSASAISASTAAAQPGETSLASPSAITVAASAIQPAGTVLASPSAVTPTAIAIQVTAATLSSTSEVTVAVTVTQPVAAALTSPGPVIASPAGEQPGGASLTSPSALTAAPTAAAAVSAALASPSAVTVGSARHVPGSAALTSPSAVGSTAIAVQQGASALAGPSAVTASPAGVQVGEAILHSPSAVAAVVTVTRAVATILASPSAISASPVSQQAGAVALTSPSGVAAEAAQSVPTAVDLGSGSAIGAAVVTVQPGTAALVSPSAVTAAVAVVQPAATILASSSLVEASSAGTQSGGVSLTSASNITAGAVRETTAVTAVGSTSAVMAEAAGGAPAAAVLTSPSVTTVGAVVGRPAAVGVTSPSAVGAAPAVVQPSGVALLSASPVDASAVRATPAAVALNSASGVAAGALVEQVSGSALTSLTALTVTVPTLSAAGAAGITSLSGLAAVSAQQIASAAQIVSLSVLTALGVEQDFYVIAATSHGHARRWSTEPQVALRWTAEAADAPRWTTTVGVSP